MINHHHHSSSSSLDSSDYRPHRRPDRSPAPKPKPIQESLPATPLPPPKHPSFPESLLILFALLLALYRLNQIPSHSIPISLLAFFIALLLPILYLRHRSSICFRVPFTDARGYRDLALADDGTPVALGLPLIVSAAVLYSLVRPHAASSNSYDQLLSSSQLDNLIDHWNKSLSPQPLNHHHHHPHYTTKQILTRLFQARLDLFSFTIINLFSLLVDISLAFIANACAYLPISNSTRFWSSSAKSLLIAAIFATALHRGYLGSISISPLECGLSVFTFQSTFYLISRLARRAFTLGEASVFASTAVALLLEIIRLTISRIKYQAYLNSHQHAHPPPLHLLPGLFRFPTPLIPIQHVLISGIFIIGFLLSPLLVWSRKLAQQPTKRTRPFSSTITSTTRSYPSPPPGRPLAQPSSLSAHTHYTPFLTPPSNYQHYYQNTRESPGNESKHRMRKILALSIYAGILWIGLLLLSSWLSWLLHLGAPSSTAPWWTAHQLLGHGVIWIYTFCCGSGPNRWTRLGILGYWAVCLSSGVGGWTTYLMRKRRACNGSRKPSINTLQSTSQTLAQPGDMSSSAGRTAASEKVVRTPPWIDCSLRGRSALTRLLAHSLHPSTPTSSPIATPHLPPTPTSKLPTPLLSSHQSQSQSHITGLHHHLLLAAEGFSNGESKVVRSLNFRRKFFHALACGMFIPSILIDPAFSSLSFSVAFVGFTLLEFLRYFAVYPIGAPLHIFFNEFIDEKDSGPVILSHFYLLTACSTGLWLESCGSSSFGSIITVLVVGWADAWASILGKRFGRLRKSCSGWFLAGNKTIEGSLGFVVSLILIGIFLESIGLIEALPLSKYIFGCILIGVLESSTNQNDNLILPLFAWSVFELLDL